MIGMPRLMTKTLYILLMGYLQKRHNLSDNALELAFLIDFNEKTFHVYKRDYFSNKERFSGSVKGKYVRFSLFKMRIFTRKLPCGPMKMYTITRRVMQT